MDAVLGSFSNDSLPQIHQNGQRHQNGDHLTPQGSTTMALDIGLERKPSRSRSNSRVYRSSVTQPPDNNSRELSHNGSNSKKEDLIKQQQQQQQPKIIHSREHFSYILRLSSLNETFDRKTLTVPVHPEVLKLGRPNSSQKAPSSDNGYFDSKVISRDQAELYVKDEQVYIRDTNSSNGTFVNTKKIVKEEPIKENDVIDLGIDIDATQSKHQHHRKITCKVDSIFIVPLNDGVSLPQVLNDLDQQDKMSKKKEVTPFDAAFFGDVSSDMDDLALGMNHDFLSGIFVNNNIGTSSNLTKSVKILMNQLHEEKMNSMKLQSVERFLDNYRVELSRNEQTAKNRKLTKELNDYRKLMEESQLQTAQFEEKLTKITEKLESREKKISEKDDRIQELEKALENHKETVTKELKAKVESNKAFIKEKETLIEQLTNETKSIKSNYESNLKFLEDKISADDKRFKELETNYHKLLDYKRHNETKTDVFNLIFISTSVLIIGLLVLKLI